MAKAKRISLLFLSTLVLAGCGNSTNSDSQSNSNVESSSSFSHEDESSSSDNNSSSSELEPDNWGNWPVEEILAFMEDTNLVVPSMRIDQEVDCGVSEIYGDFFLYCEDNGTVGIDSLEDVYKAIIDQTDWVNFNDDEYNTYDQYGYLYKQYLGDSLDYVQVQFYTYDNEFSFFVGFYTDSEEDVSGEWPFERIAAYLEGTGVTLPSIPGDYTFEVYEYDGLYIFADDNGTVGIDSLEDIYKEILEEANWTCSNDDEYTYEEYGYYYMNAATYEESAVEVNFYSSESSFMLGIAVLEHRELGKYGTFPFEELNEYLNQYNLFAPGVYSEEELYYVGYDEEGFVLYMDDYGTVGVDSLEDLFKEVIEDSGWINNNDEEYTYEEYGYFYINDIDEPIIELQFYTYEEMFYLSAYEYEEEELIVVEEGVFDFYSESQITESSSNKAVWESGNYTMTIEKNDAAVDVGNSSCFSAPLRTYAGQKITFTWEDESPTAIVVEIDLSVNNTKCTVEAASSGATITGATYSVSGTTVTYTIEEGATSVTIIVGSKQAHFSSAYFM